MSRTRKYYEAPFKASPEGEGGVIPCDTSSNIDFTVASTGTVMDDSVPLIITLEVANLVCTRTLWRTHVSLNHISRVVASGIDGLISHYGDSNIFAHVLRYLRRPFVCSLF
jgi:hypothetical protein